MKIKKEIREKENMEYLQSTMDTLESFKENKDLPRVIRNQINDIYGILKEEKNGGRRVRVLVSLGNVCEIHGKVNCKFWVVD